MTTKARTTRQRNGGEPGEIAGLRCAIYSRKSNEDDASEELRSVARQVERSREYAIKKGWTVEDGLVFIDDGISGATFGERRPGLASLLDAAARKQFDVLTMSEPSRLGRDQYETGYVLQQFAKASIAVWFYLEDRKADLDSAVGKLVESLHSFGSELERERIRQRTRDGMLRRAQAGYSTGGECYGYRSVPIYSGRMDAGGQPIRDHSERRIEPAEAKTVLGVFKMYGAGFGVTSVAKTLNGEAKYGPQLAEFFGGVRPPAPQSRPGSGTWAGTAVRDMLRQPLYAGKIEWGRTTGRTLVSLEKPELRIVPPDLWAAVQARLTERGAAYLRQGGGKFDGRAEHSREAAYLWSGFLRCAECGSALIVVKKTRVSSFYGCNFHLKRGDAVCGNGLTVRTDYLDTALLRAVEEAVLTPEALRYVLERAAEAVRRSLADDPARMEALRRQRAEAQRKVTRLVEAVAEGSAPKAILERIAIFEADLSRLDGQIAALEGRADLARLDVAKALRELAPALAAWRDILRGNAVRARQVLRKLIVGPVVMTPQADGYAWTGTLNGGAAIASAQKSSVKYSGAREPSPIL